MTWLRLDDHMGDHPKLITLSDRAFRAHFLALFYASRHSTDGFVPVQVAGRKTTTKELVSAGLWEPADGGYQVHDYLEYNPSRAEIIELRDKRSSAGRAGGTRSKHPSKRLAKPEQDASTLLPVCFDRGVSKTKPQSQTQSHKGLSPLNPQPKPRASRLTIKYDDGTPVTHAAQRLLEALTNATEGTAGRLTNLIKRGASEADFGDALQAVRETSPRNPSALACDIIERRLAERVSA